MADAERPIVLDRAATAGASIFGLPMAKIIGVGPDGREYVIALPLPTAPEEDVDFLISPKAIKAVRYFADKAEDFTVKGIVLSSALKEKDDTMRKHYSALTAMNVLEKVDGGYKRGPKYTQTLSALNVP